MEKFEVLKHSVLDKKNPGHINDII